MTIRDLFINSDDNTIQKKIKKETVIKFPVIEQSIKETNFSFSPTTSTPSIGGVSEEYLSKAVEVYQKGFDSLNQPGYDFYEFYQSVNSIGVTNQQGYPMAFTMIKTIDKTITKDKLLSQSEFYITEIEKQFNNLVSSGSLKKQQLIDNKNHENQSMSSDLDLMKQQLEQLKVQIEDRQNKLNLIDSKYQPQLDEIDGKLRANELAKNQLLNSIELVKQGIINNIK